MPLSCSSPSVAALCLAGLLVGCACEGGQGNEQAQAQAQAQDDVLAALLKDANLGDVFQEMMKGEGGMGGLLGQLMENTDLAGMMQSVLKDGKLAESIDEALEEAKLGDPAHTQQPQAPRGKAKAEGEGEDVPKLEDVGAIMQDMFNDGSMQEMLQQMLGGDNSDMGELVGMLGDAGGADGLASMMQQMLGGGAEGGLGGIFSDLLKDEELQSLMGEVVRDLGGPKGFGDMLKHFGSGGTGEGGGGGGLDSLLGGLLGGGGLDSVFEQLGKDGGMEGLTAGLAGGDDAAATAPAKAPEGEIEGNVKSGGEQGAAAGEGPPQGQPGSQEFDLERFASVVDSLGGLDKVAGMMQDMGLGDMLEQAGGVQALAAVLDARQAQATEPDHDEL